VHEELKEVDGMRKKSASKIYMRQGEIFIYKLCILLFSGNSPHLHTGKLIFGVIKSVRNYCEESLCKIWRIFTN